MVDNDFLYVQEISICKSRKWNRIIPPNNQLLGFVPHASNKKNIKFTIILHGEIQTIYLNNFKQKLLFIKIKNLF